MRALATAARVSGATNTSLLSSGLATAKPTAVRRVGAFSRARPGRGDYSDERPGTFVTTTAEDAQKLRTARTCAGWRWRVSKRARDFKRGGGVLIAEAFAEWLARKMGAEGEGRRRRRRPPAALAQRPQASFAGFANAGARAVDLGLATTPRFVSTVTASTDYDAAVMLTVAPVQRRWRLSFSPKAGWTRRSPPSARRAEKCAARPAGAIPARRGRRPAVDIVEHAPFCRRTRSSSARSSRRALTDAVRCAVSGVVDAGRLRRVLRD